MKSAPLKPLLWCMTFNLNARIQVSTAQKMWTSVSCPQMPAKMVAHVTIQWAASTACAWMAGQAMTAARTLMTAPVQPATMEPHATTASHHSTASAHMDALVSVLGLCVNMLWECSSKPYVHSAVYYQVVDYLLVYLQVCCVIWMMRASVTHVRKAPTVIPTPSTAWPSAPAHQATPALPATRTLMSAPLVRTEHSTVY